MRDLWEKETPSLAKFVMGKLDMILETTAPKAIASSRMERVQQKEKEQPFTNTDKFWKQYVL